MAGLGGGRAKIAAAARMPLPEALAGVSPFRGAKSAFTHGIFLLGQRLLHEQVKKCYSGFVHTRQLSL